MVDEETLELSDSLPVSVGETVEDSEAVRMGVKEMLKLSDSLPLSVGDTEEDTVAVFAGEAETLELSDSLPLSVGDTEEDAVDFTVTVASQAPFEMRVAAPGEPVGTAACVDWVSGPGQ